MADLKQLEFYLLRYVPFVVKGEFVNIGVLLFEPVAEGFADVRMTADWRRVSCLDRQVDIEVLQGLEAYIRLQLQQSQNVGLLPRKLEDSFANLIQISPRGVCLGEDPAREIETLCSLYLEEPYFEPQQPAPSRKNERALILSQMKDAFTRAGVWALGSAQIPAAKYTKKKGDPLVFDFGYLVGGDIRFFQSVPLKTNVNQAIILANRFPRIAERIRSETQASPHLTAVVGDDLDRHRPEVEFALDAFSENHVQVATAAEMPAIAERARQELKA